MDLKVITINLNEKELRAILWLVIDEKEKTRKQFNEALANEYVSTVFGLNRKNELLENVIETLNYTIANINELVTEPKPVAFDKWLAVKEAR
jgi:hypothetical protein